jgi:D-lyxose ketol-isomerase
MKRSEINTAVRNAMKAFRAHGWILPPNPKWDVTDFGLGNFKKYGLTLVNLTEEPEYCEKIMFVMKGQITPRHYHKSKKEDIICRWGRLAIRLFGRTKTLDVKINGEVRRILANQPIILKAGERITLPQRLPHEFWAVSSYAIVGEVSTANDDLHDNFFADRRIGRFSKIEEDEKPIVKLVSD